MCICSGFACVALRQATRFSTTLAELDSGLDETKLGTSEMGLTQIYVMKQIPKAACSSPLAFRVLEPFLDMRGME